MSHQIPLSVFTGVYEDLTNPDNDLLGFFAQIDVAAVERVLADYYSGRGPAGYGAARYLALLLRVKQNTDRRLVADLATNELYRRAIGLGGDPTAVPGRSALSAFRARLGPEGFWALHRHFVGRAHAAGLSQPDLPQLPRNRRRGLILIVDGTFLRAYCHQHPTTDADGVKRFTDPSAAYGRRHPIYRYAVGHKAHSLVTAGGLPLVSIVAPANQLDQTHLLPLLQRFRALYPDLEVAYLLLDKGYDVEALYRAVYQDYGIIPVAPRKTNIAYPDGFSARGRPLCAYGIELARRGTDYTRRRTKFCCEHRCRAPTPNPPPAFRTAPTSTVPAPATPSTPALPTATASSGRSPPTWPCSTSSTDSAPTSNAASGSPKPTATAWNTTSPSWASTPSASTSPCTTPPSSSTPATPPTTPPARASYPHPLATPGPLLPDGLY